MSLVNFNEEFKDKSVKFVARFLTVMLLVILPTLFIITILKITNNEHVRVLGFEFNIPNMPDTIYQTKTILYKPDTSIKYKDSIQSSQSAGSSTMIDAKNVNTGNNNGIIGDYGTINRAEQRHLNDSLKNHLLQKIDSFLKENELNKLTPIVLCFRLGDEEAEIFTSEVENFLLSQLYNIKVTTMGSGPFERDFGIRQSNYWEDNMACIEMSVGTIDIGLGKR